MSRLADKEVLVHFALAPIDYYHHFLDGHAGVIPNFTEEENRIFTRRLEEGYDLQTDAKYNLWLKTYYSSLYSEGLYYATGVCVCVCVCVCVLCVCVCVCVCRHCMCVSLCVMDIKMMLLFHWNNG